tara:strand:+ start:323 stop:4285 length:3963 start_codon:yes stop_codon:yes gene_type:complete
MALEGGGFADKFGNSYEEFWVAEQLLRLVEEEITSVTVEPLGEDETGVDLIVEKSNGSREFHQCKSSHNNSDVWTLSSLEISGVLIKAFNQIQRTDCTFKVVSPLSFTQLSQLSLSAKNTTSNPQDFIEHQVDQSGKRRKLFEDLCHKLGLNINVEIDIAKAIQFLKNFEVIAFPANSESQRNIIGKIDKNFSSNSNNIVDYLKNYPTDNNLRSSITSFQLLESMKGQGFNQRIYENDTRLFPIIERVNQAFRDSITPFLIEGSLIERSEMANCIDSIDNYPITLIKAEAGMGKSAFLLQLCDEMQKKGHICLPIRLDRNRPKKNADAFGDDLGFSHSPVFSLNKFAGAKKAIIILDQLDAIRWTASHSSSALQVCQQIAYQVIQLRKDNYDISLVLACRDFDLNEDIQLQSWISSLNNKVAHITIKELSVVEVKKLLSPYENYDSLSPVKQTILKIPIWLSFYIQLIKNDQGSLNFNSKSDLISLYWVDRLKQLNNAINDLSSANTIIDDFIEKASREMQFSISINALCSHNPNVLEAIISVGIFNKTGNQVSFQHQALFDYHLGKRLFDIARQSSDDFLKEIGSKSEQTLIRREHIKYALKLLSQSRQSVFCENISALFDSSEIRFHVKYLAINMVGEIKVIKTPMRNLITSLINNEELSQPFIDHACFGHSQLVTVLSEKNIISRWLNGSDSEIGLAIRLLSSIADKAPDIVLKEIEPFIGISEEWNNRCYSALSWNIQNDSEKMFEVRKKLLQLGCAVNYIDWNELAKSYPRKAIDLIQLILEGYKEELTDSSLDIKESEESVKHLHRKVWREGQIEDLESISEALPYDVLKELMLQVFEIINSSINESSYTRIWLYSARHSFNEHRDSLVRGVLGIFFEAGKQYTDKPDELFNLLTLYLTNKHPVVEHIIANLLLNLPIGYSDQIIKWLLDNPTTRLACGNDYEEPRWVLAGKLIDKFSPYCEDEIFNCLEIVISGIGLSKDLESIEHTTAESLMQNSINCYRGIAYGGIAKIFWDNEEYARDNLSLIDSAINDPHPAVKIVAVRLLTPFLNYDINYALQRFLDLCKSDLRMSCAYESYNFFNSAFIDKFKDQYIDLVRLMLTSEYEEVRRQAGTQIFARYFFNDLFAKEIFSVLMADESVKLGVAQVLVQLLTTDDYAEQEHKLVEVYRSLLNDDSQKVRGNLLSCIREKNFWNKGITEELVDIYMNSQVVNKKLYHLFYALENHVLCLSDFKSMLLQLFIEIATASLSDETKQIVYSEMDKLTKILQRIYDEAVDDEDDVTLSLCLDVWDNLLKSDSYEVKRATRYIENGLLS